MTPDQKARALAALIFYGTLAAGTALLALYLRQIPS